MIPTTWLTLSEPRRRAPSPTADTAGVMNARPTSTATAITSPRVAARSADGGGAALTSGGAKCDSDPPATTAITVLGAAARSDDGGVDRDSDPPATTAVLGAAARGDNGGVKCDSGPDARLDGANAGDRAGDCPSCLTGAVGLPSPALPGAAPV